LANWSRLTLSEVAAAVLRAEVVDPDDEVFATEPLPALDCPMDNDRPPAHAVSPA
jgi:hypothetical protein